jgi:NAD(P)-dependent dehydrogenase (short-subunit alcohol dehydrogenase family)
MPSRVAVVTGAGGDIGGACAQRLTGTAEVVVCVDRDADRLAATAARLGPAAVPVVADADDPAFGPTVAEAAASLGTTVAAVHALAYEEHTPADELSLRSLQRSLAAGPVAAFSLFQQLSAQGCLASGSALTAIGSLHARLPFARTLGYNAAHAALAQVVMTLAHEWAPRGIRVNLVAPGWIRTQGEAQLYGEDLLDRTAAALPMGRFGTAEEVAAAVGFLSGEASGYISGTCLTVDGALGVSLARLPIGSTQ